MVRRVFRFCGWYFRQNNGTNQCEITAQDKTQAKHGSVHASRHADNDHINSCWQQAIALEHGAKSYYSGLSYSSSHSRIHFCSKCEPLTLLPETISSPTPRVTGIMKHCLYHARRLRLCVGDCEWMTQHTHTHTHTFPSQRICTAGVVFPFRTLFHIHEKPELN